MNAIRGEDPALVALREALGVIAVAPPLAFCLTRNAAGQWCLRRLDQGEAQTFDSRDAALQAWRLAVVRCSGYCLLVEGCSGAFDIQFMPDESPVARRSATGEAPISPPLSHPDVQDSAESPVS